MTKSDKVITVVSTAIISLLMFGGLMGLMAQYGVWLIPSMLLVIAVTLMYSAIIIAVALGIIVLTQKIIKK